MKAGSWAEQALANVWYCCDQMSDYEIFAPRRVTGAHGTRIVLDGSHEVIDAISSWWCRSLGHGHQALVQAVQTQLEQTEHVMLPHLPTPAVVELGQRLAGFFESLDKVYFSGGDGATAVEVAVKMAVQAQRQRGRSERSQLAALENGYHGDTALCMNLSDISKNDPARVDLGAPVVMLGGLPHTDCPAGDGQSDPAGEASLLEAAWARIEAVLDPLRARLCAVIVEPVVQGAVGMHMYAPELLSRLRAWTKQHDVFLIADEIFTGFWRTGAPMACHLAGIEPDFVCVSKGLTAGSVPLSAVLTSSQIYETFYGEPSRAFLHSNTYAGNALGAAAGVAALDVYQSEALQRRLPGLAARLAQGLREVASVVPGSSSVRHVGAIAAFDLPTRGLTPEQLRNRRLAIYRESVARGALVRPIGSTVYWAPPFITTDAEIDVLRAITIDTLRAVA